MGNAKRIRRHSGRGAPGAPGTGRGRKRPTPIPRCAPMPKTHAEMERGVRECQRQLGMLNIALAREHSPAALLLAVSFELGRLCQAHLRAGLLKPGQLKELVMQSCFAPGPRRSVSRKAR
jgi:hypothetical protein